MNEKARWLTGANVVSFVRLLLTVPIVYALLQEGSLWRWAGLILLLAAAASDGLDGYLARSRGEISPLGQLLDPIADKVLSIALLAVLLHQALLPPWMFWALFVKEALLLLGGAVLLRRGLRVPSARTLGKVATVVLFIGFLMVIAGLSLGLWVCGTGVILSLAAGLDYAREARHLWSTAA